MSDTFKEMQKKKESPQFQDSMNQEKWKKKTTMKKKKITLSILFRYLSIIKRPEARVTHGLPVRASHNIATVKPDLPKTGGPKRPDLSPLDWSAYYDRLEYLEDGTSVFIAGSEPPLFVMLHGAGHSALSFACVAKEIKKFATVAAFDFKGHGHSKYDKDLEDFSSDKLVDETISVYKQLENLFPAHMFVVVGHSMGGSIATKSVEEALITGFEDRIQGLVVIDVVEGTALEALPFMEAMVTNRPQMFRTPSDAAQYNLRSHQTKNQESARVGSLAQLVEKENAKGEKYFTWKVDLMKGQKYWTSWFDRLTEAFLKIRIPKLLILAEKERMDKELTIAQMQGKFKLVVYQNVGHHVHEDDPLATAKSLYTFVDQFKVPISVEDLTRRNEVGVGKFHPALKAAPWPL